MPYVPFLLSLLLAVASFAAGLAPVGIGLAVIAAGLLAFQRKQGRPAAERARRMAARVPHDPLPPAHQGQARMTPDDIPSPRA